MPSPYTNSSPERFYEASNCTVRSFTNPKTFSCYVHVIKSEGGNILIDPGYYDGDLKEYVESIGGVDVVLLSHCHVDHIIGLNALKRDYPNAKVYIGASDLEGRYRKLIKSYKLTLMFHSSFIASVFTMVLLLTFGMMLQRLKFPTNVSVHINSILSVINC